MKSTCCITAVCLTVVVAASAHAQTRAPRIGYVYPAGVERGTTVVVTLGGQFLDGPTSVHVTGEGVQAKVSEYIKPINQAQANKLKDQLKELMDRRAAAQKGNKRGTQAAEKEAAAAKWTDADEKLLAEIRKKLATFVRRPANPAIVETVSVEITAAANAEPGQRELRLGTAAGLTNPLVFHIGTVAEFSEKRAASVDTPKFAKYAPAASQRKTSDALAVTLPATVNGQIMPGEVDRFRFAARKGQKLVIATTARGLMPYLADAVPGWFQATLALYDEKGREVAYADDYRFSPDPVILYEVPADGEYVAEIKDSIYRGREDFVYRITIGELPFITSAFPLGGPAGKPTAVELVGWNLPANKAAWGDTATLPGTREFFLRGQNGQPSNAVPLAFDVLPERLEKESNDDAKHAEAVTLPVIVNGRIGQAGDCDVFSFTGRKGDRIVAEVRARRLGSPLDSLLKLTDSAGNIVATNDDCEDKAAGLLTHHADSYLAATLPADGTYYVQLTDAEKHGGPEYAYRLRISPPQPDFELRVVPASVNIRAGTAVPITVYALRRDGFNGPIALKLKDAPAGFTIGGAIIAGDQEQARATLSAGATDAGPFALTVLGEATLDGRKILRPAAPADDMMQAFAYRHLVPCQQLVAAVEGRAKAGSVKLASDAPVKLPCGGEARVRFIGGAAGAVNRFSLELSDPPEGIALKNVATTRDGVECVLTADAEKVKPGQCGNLIIGVFGKGVPSGKGKAPNSTPVASLPAVPFEIVDR